MHTALFYDLFPKRTSHKKVTRHPTYDLGWKIQGHGPRQAGKLLWKTIDACWSTFKNASLQAVIAAIFKLRRKNSTFPLSVVTSSLFILFFCLSRQSVFYHSASYLLRENELKNEWDVSDYDVMRCSLLLLSKADERGADHSLGRVINENNNNQSFRQNV